MAKRVDLPKSNLRLRRRKRRVIVSGILSIFVLLVFLIAVGVTWLPFIRIQAVKVSGEKTIPESEITRVAEAELMGGYLHLFAKNNIFLYPRTDIRRALLTKLPTLADVGVQASNFQTVSVVVTERQPAALWCGEVLASSSSCFLIDQVGLVFAPAVVYSGDAYQKFYGQTNGDILPQQYLDQEKFRSLSALTDAIQKKQHVRVRAIAVDVAGDVRVVFDSGFALIFSLSANNGDVFDRLQLALMADPFTTHTLSDFEYLDLRFGDKLYYKLKTVSK